MNYEFKIEEKKIRKRPIKSEVSKLLSNNKKALKILKWKPKYIGSNGFKKGLIKTIQWFEENKDKNFFKKNYTK